MDFRVSDFDCGRLGWFSGFDCGSQDLDLFLSLGWLSAVRPGVVGLRALLGCVVCWYDGVGGCMLTVSYLWQLTGLVGLLRMFSFGGWVLCLFLVTCFGGVWFG